MPWLYVHPSVYIAMRIFLRNLILPRKLKAEGEGGGVKWSRNIKDYAQGYFKIFKCLQVQ